MVPDRDIDPHNCYSGIASATCIKIALAIAALYLLIQKAFDMVGAYLVTPRDQGHIVYVHTPES